MQPYVYLYTNRNGKFQNLHSINEIRKFNNDALEEIHDFIQILFPLNTPSSNTTLPPISSEEIAIFNGSDLLKYQILINLTLMCKFYGCKLNISSEINEQNTRMDFVDICVNALPHQIHVFYSRDYQQRINNIGMNVHNLLRLTRILSSLYIFGLKNYGNIFYENILANLKKNLDTMFARDTNKLGIFNRSFSIWTNVYQRNNQ